ncbi:Lecithin:cholesterol acyltransferase family protein [Trichomonas vaginalis G3]|uniref:Lecithin:cholesterol acyltransferase family protein n=1 Tax=Trichomonas vaginalis (strain ATCC PRA-98 / G3) TaxID=412133 RepID=A2FNC8_TRIV3|nr:O-acyltransferase protein [Trichomonas vaginalis G3]EAX93591.1 Lecithin:cholesterol acyltransferase family protein [Trichomonas vaginalis G3]KAI5541220.1 O-acyltransferase protein [Trichomonas vaginalis G3]|eukprot:XP_001306521.1 Lecithin:cholesterol acyltransferase family protein [Trichomonas vaginalis G3]
MLACLFAQATSLRPILLLPGIYGSNLFATYDNFAKHWYCPKKQDHDIFWVNLKYIIPPTWNCLFEMLTAHYYPETDTIGSAPGMQVEVDDFGGEAGIKYVDKGVFGFHFIESFAPMLEYLKAKGYTVKKDLFGVPYDWRLAMDALRSTFFPQLKALIEEAYEKNDRKAVVVLGYSCGGLCLQNFLTAWELTQKWKDKYIHKVIMLAPAFGGSSNTIDVAYNQYFPIVPFIKNDILRQAVENMPVLNGLFPNHYVFQNDTIIITDKGEEIKAPQLPEFYLSHGKYNDGARKIFKKNLKWVQREPKPLGVKTYMLYNSGVDTTYTVDYRKGYDDPQYTYTGGDGTVPAKGPRYACDHWQDPKHPIICHDVNRVGDDWEHAPLSTNEYIHQVIYNATNDLNDGWSHLKGTWYFESHDVQVFNTTLLHAGRITRKQVYNPEDH